MKEIKYRVWNGKRFLIGHVNRSGGFLAWDENYDPQLFTGLLDKNGKEIYEGDVVEYETSTRKHKGKIVPISGGYAWKHAGIDFHLWDMDEEKLEVIGNIYEHPELLKESGEADV